MKQHCEYTDAIIARHLDGDVDAEIVLEEISRDDDSGLPTWQPYDQLADHLRECTICHQQLQRSRRLDALLAEASGRDQDPEQDNERLSALLDRAVAASGPLANTGTGRRPARRAQYRLLSSALLVTTGVLAALLVVGPWRTSAEPADATRPADPAPLRVADSQDSQPATPTLPEETQLAASDSAAFALRIPMRQGRPATTPRRSEAPTRPSDDQLAAVLGDRQLADRLLLTDSLRLSAYTGRVVVAGRTAQQRVEAGELARQIRLQSSQQLLRSRDRSALRLWIETVAHLDGGPLLEDVLAEARQNSALRSRLRSTLRSTLGRRPSMAANLNAMATLATAARIGGNEIDGTIRQLLRREALYDEVAAAVRVVQHRPGRTALLLDAWRDQATRGSCDDEVFARMLFAQQPTTVAAELTAELQDTRRTRRRVQCLLALGALGAPTARSVLLASMGSPSLDEAHAAAFALGMLPHDDLTDLLARAQSGPQDWLLRAALCCAGEPQARAWIESLEVTEAEHELLTTGGFSFAQFPVFADLLRQRGTPSFQ